MPSGLRTWLGPMNYVLHGGSDPPMGRGKFRGENGRPFVKYRDFLPCSVQIGRDVNETLAYETETRPRHSVYGSRRDRDRDLARPRPRRFSRPSTFQSFGHNRHGPKIGGWLCPFLWEGLDPHLTMSPGPRSTSIASGILIHPAVWPFGHNKYLSLIHI